MRMSTRCRRVPKYRHYKPKNLGVVRIDGQDFYLGPYDSPQSWEKYHRLLAEKFARPAAPNLITLDGSQDEMAVKDLILAYVTHADAYYVKNGKPTGEQFGIRAALRPVRKLYGNTSVNAFGPLALKAARQEMVKADNCRGVINHHVSRIRRMFRWGVENELVRVETYQAIMAVAGFAKNRSPARETHPIRSVSDEAVQAAAQHLSPVLQAMIQFQRLTGCRPGEVCILRPCDLDRTTPTWCYRPETYKTEHHDQERRIFIGPGAQLVLSPWLNRPQDSYCFSPRESAGFERKSDHQTKTQQQKAKRPRVSRRGLHYTTNSYRRAITRACSKANIPAWHPNQLRHARATELRKRFGLEGVQTVLGHEKADITQTYAERDFALAERIMSQVG
jgi:integrase